MLKKSWYLSYAFSTLRGYALRLSIGAVLPLYSAGIFLGAWGNKFLLFS